MHRRSIPIFHLTLGAIAALWLGACASSDPLTGRNILAELQAHGVRASGDPLGTRPLIVADAEPALPARGITLADLLEAAQFGHPRLTAAGVRVGEAAARAWQASLYPNPHVGVSLEDVGWQEGLDGSTTLVTVSQPVVIGGRLKAAIAAADAEKRATIASLESERREVFAEIASLHATILALSAQERALDDAIVAAEQTLSVVRTRVEANAAPQPDLLRPRVESARMESDRAHLRVTREAAEDRLGMLVGVDRVPAEALADVLDLTPAALDLELLNARLKSDHPRLIAFDLEAAAALSRVKSIDASRVPDLILSAGAGYDDEDGEGVVEFGVGSELPLWDDRRGDLLAARLEVVRLGHERHAMERQLLGELRQEFARHESARRQLGVLNERILPDAREAFEQIEASYRAGRSAFIEVLDAQRTLLDASRSAAALAGEAAIANAAMMRLVGVGTPAPAPNQMFESPISPSLMEQDQ